MSDIDTQAREFVEQYKASHPGARLFQIILPGREELYMARKASWGEYKSIAGQIQSVPQLNEVLVQRFLVCPKPDYEAMQNEWDPGLVVALAGQIQKGLGFAEGAAIKNW